MEWVPSLLHLLRARGYTDISPPTSQLVNKNVYVVVLAQYLDPRTSVSTILHCCLVPEDTSFNKKDVLAYTQLLAKGTKFIVVTRLLGSQSAQCLRDQHVQFEHLKHEDICYHKTDHILVPHYRWLSRPEIAELEKRYGDRKQFPKMVADVDAIARYLNFQVGDVLQVRRKTQFAEVSYRLVISSNHE